MTIEALFAEATARRLRINNLFERNDGIWQANTRTDDPVAHCYEFGLGATPQEALRAALDKSDGPVTWTLTADADIFA
jgi:hypothetical protein